MANIAAKILLDELTEAHKYMFETMEGVTNKIAAFQPHGTANPIAGTYAHLALSEDFFLHFLLQGKKPLFETTWKNKTGADSLQPTEWEKAFPKWLREVKVDIQQMNTYYKAVAKASEAYVSSLTDNELAKDVDMSMFGMGTRPMSSTIGMMIIMHINNIMGEIAVLKGIQGLKGYPF